MFFNDQPRYTKNLVFVNWNTHVYLLQEYSRELPYSQGEVLFPITEERFSLFLGAGFSNFERLYEALNNTGLEEFLKFTDIRIRWQRSHA